ncbi:ABC-type sugar transport system, permease component [Sphaerochaeta pleomorpha str. Grapes]|uniref:ABC-type sugar transport system, permease component n=1 Tax=Sphaerochaeta pleomorpha (strain ATCC BAA-1885 / DSM 22778 / Grapes) TaxID=158190 RepID=G8QSC9_SPHPG|nr:carbohydrate ABC transporter permease [Sphaerochaeta pleomorpha]AEV30059.1 ABC-type sugar transport system, permease component [Sphaerochaeta pleomorpha str. Grapes]
MFQKTVGFKIFFWVFLVMIGFFAFFPQLWMISTSLKPESEMFTFSFFRYFDTGNILRVLSDTTFLRYLRNGIVVAVASSFCSTVVSVFAGYSFSKFRYKGRKSVMALIMISQAFPQGLLLLSLYPMMQKIGMLDKLPAIILAYVALTLPVGTWTLKAYFDQVPASLLEAARVDGSSEWRTMFQIIIPLAIPGMMTIAIYSFVWAWNDLLYALTLISSTANRTLASGMIFTFTGEGGNDWIGMMAASVVASIPVAVMFVFLQRYFIAGLTAGAVKG